MAPPACKTTGSNPDTLLATVSSRPYTAAISTLSEAPGTYTIYGQATDNLGATSPVQSTTFTVTPTLTSFVTQAISDTAIIVTWSPVPAGVNVLDLERSSNGGAFSSIAVLTGTTTSYTDTGLQPATQYAYRIRGTTGRVNGAYINAAALDTLLPGDADGDGTVGPNDLAIVLANLWHHRRSATLGHRRL